ncbi:ABC-type transporter, integral membrane subunit (plasmid) [Deinococcus proteolyticus MRP]|uniref:ABC-type transporter, integral membrane subunit n=1 Tax=Deinococcus proteolyticus (strain ATCC 35074 / DSM 20540 / JCM 6276 / NBRC 101906 / NCIMB 13154 / VKM Ac-1939 / CCM 2703 / MRP) TaxID=693977 RepID=F0RQZ1_DEIPM|nr:MULTISPECIES: iron ABC transporter permease [Deinococcus]ADY27700.1 ABC-type transporter, integral membrane subunit [Deinococcus proteolyticus MRP]MCY1703463.1 iron ABC transporter permease [Deinococcus sp. SL84]
MTFSLPPRVDHVPPQGWRQAALPLGLGLGVLTLAFFALGVGAVPTPPADLWAALSGQPGETADLTRRLVFDLRLPRVVAALLGGAMFAVSGTILQAVVRNPLASPDLVGVGAGAGLAVILLLLVLPDAPGWLLPWGAFLGAWGAFLLVLALAHSGGAGGGARLPPVRLALLGVAVGAACGALGQLALLRAPDHVGGALAFLAGTVYGADWARAGRALPWALTLLPAAWLLGRRLDLLALGEDTALALGHRVTMGRYGALLVAVGLAAAAVTACGVLGFVGLVAPHLARLLAGNLHGRTLPVSALLGAALVLAADTLGRILSPPLEVPAGLITTLLGAPYFLYLLRRGR